MGFDVLSAATTTGYQLANSDILNSMVSKLIHDQAESSFCWAFAISSMLRQSLKMFFHQAWDHGTVHNRSFDLYSIAYTIISPHIPLQWMLTKMQQLRIN